MNKPLQQLYNALKSNNYGVPDTYDSFERTLTAKGQEGVKNRQQLYRALRANNYDVPDSYDSFARTLFTPTAKQNKQQRGTLMTDGERQKFIRNARNIAGSASGAVQRTKKQVEYAKKKRGLQVKTPVLGQNTNVVEGEPKYNEQGQKQSTYLTSAGNEYDNRALADMEQQQLDDPIGSDIRAAEAEQARLEELIRKRREQIDEERNDAGFLTKLARSFADVSTSGKVHPSTQQQDVYNYDKEYQQLMSALRKNKALQVTLRDKKSGQTNSFWHSLGDELTNGYTFSYGGENILHDAMAVQNAKKHINAINAKRQSGEKLTHDEEVAEALLHNVAWDNEVQAKYGDQYGAWARAGKSAATSIDMALDFALGMKGITGIAKGTSRFIAKQALKALGKQELKGLGKYMLKSFGATVGSMAAGATLANTVQLPRLIGKTAAEHEGEIHYDENGNYQIDNAKSFLASLAHAERDLISEAASEVSGEFMNIGGTGIKLLKNIGLSKAAGWLTSIGAKGWYKNYNNILKNIGFHGLAGEGFEEYTGYLYNAIMGNIDDLSQLADAKTHLDIWLATVTYGSLLNAPNAVASGTNAVALQRSKHNLNKADKVASYRLTPEIWQPIREQIDGAKNEDMTDVLWNIINNKELHAQQKQAVVDYAKNLQQMRGFSLGSVAQENAEQSDEEEKQDPIAKDADQSYIVGYNLDEADGMNDVKNTLDVATQRLSELLDEQTFANFAASPVQALQYIYDNEQWSEEDKQIAIDYVNARSAYDGMLQRVRDDIDLESEQIRQTIASRRHQVDGDIHPATMKVDDRQVYIINGNVRMMEDGTMIDRSRSDNDIIIIDANTGKIEFTSADQIERVEDVVNADELLQTSLANTQQTIATAAANKIDGKLPFNVGDVYTLPDEQGNTHTFTIMSDAGNGSVTVDVDGEIMQIAKESLQAMNDSLNMSRTTQEVEQTDEQEDAGDTIAAVPDEEQTAMTDEEDDSNIEQNRIAEEDSEVSDAMPMIGEGEDAEPDFMSVTPQRGHQYIYDEAGLPKEVADQFVLANIKSAEKEVEKINAKKPAIGTKLNEYRSKLAEWQNKADAAQATLQYWKDVQAEQRVIDGREQARRAELQRKETEQAIADEQQRQQEVIAKREEQERIGSNSVAPTIKEKWDKANKIEGASNEITLANGERVRGKYILVESGAATPSHNVNDNFKKSEGFPLDENEQSVNDRDYERDSAAQDITRQIAGNYDSRAIQTPVVVSNDGVVLSGNGRTMAGELAARDNTDGAYIDYLRRYPQQYGFTAEQVDSMQHPRVLFVPDEAMPYTTETFAKFNQQDMKGQSKTEQAVKLGKVVDDNTFGRIVRAINAYDTLGEFYSDTQATTQAIGELLKAGAINQMQYDSMFDGDTISEQGKEILENMLIGKAFESNPDAVRQLTAYKSLRQSVISALAEVSNNIALGEEYSLESELAEAIALAYNARQSGYKAGDKVSEFARQGNLFAFDDGATVADYTNATVMLLADVLNDTRVTRLKKFLTVYNDSAKESAAGQLDIFSGTVKDKQDIFNEINQLFSNGTAEQQQSAINQSVENRKSAASAERSRENESTEQADVSSNGSEGNATVEEPNAVQAALAAAEQETNTEPTEAQKEAGNYKKGHVKIDGYNITIENPKGSERSGQDKDGKKWSITMNNTYGYILATEGVDGDHIDVFLSDNPSEGNVYVIDQVNADGSFDEHKVMYGFPDIESARKAYLSNYEEGWQGLGNITGVSKEEFKKWVDSSHRKTKPFAEYSNVKPLGDIQAKESRETALRDGLIDKLRNASIEVITDEEEAQRVLDAANGEVTLQKRLSDLQKAEDFIEESLKGKHRGQRMEIELPVVTQRKIRRTMGRDFDSHNIFADGIVHSKKNHGKEGEKLDEKSIPLRDEDFKLAPYIMVSPDRVSKGSWDTTGRKSIRFEKDLSNGVVLVVEKEQKNSPDDMDTITMWATLSSRVIDARSNERPLSSTSQPADVAKRAVAPEKTNARTVITSFDAAKIRKDAETAIKNDEKVSLHKVFHGSGNDFERFDHSHMGEGEGAQAYGWGTYVTEVEGIGKTYAQQNARHYYSVSIDGKEIDTETGSIFSEITGERVAAETLHECSGDTDTAITFIKSRIVYFKERLENHRRMEENDIIKWYIKDELKKIQACTDAINVLQSGKIEYHQDEIRILYTVEIPEDAETYYLDYTLKMGDQQDILEGVDNALYAQGWHREELDSRIRFTKGQSQIILTPDQSGADLYAELENAFGSDKLASEFLHDEVGVTGMKYPAEYRSGGRSDGSSNYVIFDEKDLKITDKIKFLRTDSGEVYGFTKDGKIYIDPRKATAETPVHEFTHLWADGLRKANPKAWEQLKSELEKEKDLFDYVKSLYPELSGDDLIDEVFAHFSGRRGAERLRSEQEKMMQKANGVFDKAKITTMFDKLRNMLHDFWAQARDLFAGKTEGIEKLSAEDFADMALADLIKGEKPLVEGKKETRFNKAAGENKSLMGVHNISAEKLSKAIKHGGLANPSLAVIDTDERMHNDYGEISLIPKAELLNAKGGRNAGTYLGDAWTPTYPGITQFITKQGEKHIEALAKQLANGNRDVELFVKSRLRDYAEQNGSSLHLAYLLARGKNPELKGKETKYSHEEYEALEDIFGEGVKDVNSDLTEEQHAKLKNLIMSFIEKDIEERSKDIQDAETRNKAKEYLREIREKAWFDEEGRLKFSKWDSYVYNVKRSERIRQNPEIDWGSTESEAHQRILKEGLTDDYNNWLQEVFDDGDIEEKLFAGFTPSGNRRYLPNTVENASKLMNRNSDTNAYDNGGFSATRSSLLQKVTTLAQIRKNKGKLKASDEIEEKTSEMSDRLFNIISQIADMQKISDNRFMNTDYAESRLQDAITKRDPIRYLNEEYGYDIDNDSDLAKEINDFIKDTKELPVKYFETKFKRPVRLDEFAIAVVPENTSPDIVNSLKAAGLDVRTYDNSNQQTRNEERERVTKEAVRERDDILFRNDDVDDVNERFNEDLELFKSGKMKSNEVLILGHPSQILRECGINSDTVIRLTQSVLSKHLKKHNLKTEDLRGLPKALATPILVYKWGSKAKSHIIITDMEVSDGRKITVAIHVSESGSVNDITDIASVHGKDAVRLISEINTKKTDFAKDNLQWADKEKALAWLSMVSPKETSLTEQELNSAAKIIKEFENPNISEEKMREGQDVYPKKTETITRKQAIAMRGRIQEIDNALEDENISEEDYDALMEERNSIQDKFNRSEIKRTPKEEREREEYARRQWNRAHEVAKEWTEKLNLNDDVQIVDELTREMVDELMPNASEEVKEKALKAKGWFNEKTGKIVIAIGNHRNPEDVMQTILHEGVAHYGLRKLFGENFNTFLDNVYATADVSVRQRIVELAAKHGYDFRTATEEYLAKLAETTNFERHQKWWENIKRLFLDMLHAVGLRSFGENYQSTLSDNELRYILWRSYDNMTAQERNNDVFRQAKDIAMQTELKVGNYEESKEPTMQEAAEGDTNLLFREGDFSPRDRAIARDTYERMVSTGGYQFQEAVQDSMLGLKRLYQAIIGKKTRMEDIAGFENAYLAENRMSSVNAAEQQEYYIRYMKPLLKAISDIVGTSNDKRLKLTDYIMAKHGLERNVIMAQRDFDVYQQQYPNGTKTLDDFRERDYSGLTALTGEDDVTIAEQVAQQMVDDYEREYDTATLWLRINDATAATLAKIYNSGLLSKERYEQIQKMFEYYVPLQGWDETTSDEVYGYLTSKNGPLGSSPIKHAKGRSTKADDPIATIALMADDAIRQGNRNKMKQTFMNFVLNHPSDLVSVNSLWLQYNAVNDEWEPVFADIEDNDTAVDIERKVEAFEVRMQQLAESDPDNYKRGRDAQNIPYKVVKGNLKEHQVLVRLNGRTYVLTINGNPRAAQALNGLTNPDVETGGVIGNLMQGVQWINRNLSAFYTTRSPDFVASNFLRDMLYSNCMAWVKESPKYALRFHKNFGRFNPAHMRKLLGKWNNGTLDDGNYTEHLFKQFMMNGGETGYTNIKDIEGHKREIATELKRNGSNVRKAWIWLGEQFDLLNGSVENCARFAAFVTSREEGRSIERSIYDAKEISVNFNKKGSGGKMVNATGQTLLGKVGSYVGGGGRLLYVFWNAGVQGTTNFARAAKHHPAKATAGAASVFMLGAMIPLLAQAMGGDDDDMNAYYNLPEYVRRSNIIINAGNQWVTIPLPVEFRALYGLGELAMGVITGKERYSDSELAFQLCSQISQILPLDMLEGGGGINPFLPSAAKPFVEAYILNKNWTGLPIYKDTPWNKNAPEWTKAYKSANTFLVSSAKWLNDISGGDEYKKGFIDINPAKVEYLLSGMFGGAFTTIDKLVKMSETIFSDREFEWRNILIANRVVKTGDERTANRKLSNEYFKYKEEYEETKRLLKKYSDEAATNERYQHRLERLQQSEEYLQYDVFDNYQPMLKCLNEAKEGANEATFKAIENEENALRRDMVNLMHAIEDDKSPDINTHVDAMLKREFEKGGMTQKPAGSRIAKRLGGKDSYGGKAQSDYQRIYQQKRNYFDLAEDVLLQTEMKKAKEAGDDDKAKDIQAARNELADIRKDLGTGNDDEVMRELRQVRKEILQEFGLTVKR